MALLTSQHIAIKDESQDYHMLPSLKRYQTLLRNYLMPLWRQLISLFVLLLVSTALLTLEPLILQQFIHMAQLSMPLITLLQIASLFFCLAILQPISSVIEMYVAENMSLQATNKLRSDLVAHCLQLDPDFFTEHTPGELVERVDGDASKLSNFFSHFLVSLIGNALLLLCIEAIFFSIHVLIGSILTAFMILSLFIMYRMQNRTAPHWRGALQSWALLCGFLEERLAGTEDIRSSGAVQSTLYEHASLSQTMLHKYQVALQLIAVGRGTMVLLFAIGSTISLALGVYLFRLGSIPSVTIYTIYYYTLLLNAPIEQIVEQWRDFQQSAGSISRILDLFARQSCISDAGNAQLPAGPLSLKFTDVSFAYTDAQSTIKHMTFTLQPGTVLGLLGRTGSGKSTITKLITRLYDPQEGTIQLGGVDLRSIPITTLRDAVGIVTQDVHIFHTTLRNNLTLFDDSIPDEKLIESLEILGCGQWYHALPQGLDTRFTPEKSGLSAGEAQLLSLARLFVRNPQFIILDEASSRLDPATEALLEQAIDYLLQGRTALIIAHHLSTIRRADTIMIIEDGQCQEYGPREQLLNNPHSRFSQLLHIGLEEILA